MLSMAKAPATQENTALLQEQRHQGVSPMEKVVRILWIIMFPLALVRCMGAFAGDGSFDRLSGVWNVMLALVVIATILMFIERARK